MANPNRPPFDSATYPYFRVIQGANTLKGAELIPYKILMYLLDMPDSYGYTPPTSNDYPRARLLRYLWNDGPRPLDGPMPTTQEKLGMLYDGEEPDINTDEQKQRHPKGYRLFTQRNVNQSGIEAKTIIKIYPGRIIDNTDFQTVMTFNCEIWSNYGFTSNTKTTALDRTFDIEQCLRESLNGVDIGGVGSIHMARVGGSFNGSEILYTDGLQCGRMLYFSISWSDSGNDLIKSY